MLFQLSVCPQTVQQERAAFFKILEHIILLYVGLIVACHEVSVVDQVCRLYRLFSESQVGNSYTA